MDKTKRISPYTRLLESFREYVNAVELRHQRSMWVYPKARLGESWGLTDLNERVAAASQLGYDVILRATDEGLQVRYIKQIPQRPYEVQ